MLVVKVISATSTALPLAGALNVLKADATCSGTLLQFLFLLATPFGGCYRSWDLFFFGGRSIH